jgi:molybdopterin-binding protein
VERRGIFNPLLEVKMKISARNQFSGTVKQVVKGPVSAEVTVTIAPGIDVVAVISTTSADNLGLAIGKPAQVLIKASSVLVGVD